MSGGWMDNGGTGLSGSPCEVVSQLPGTPHILEYIPTGWTESGTLTHRLATANSVSRAAHHSAVMIIGWMIGAPAAIRVPT